MSKTVPPYVEGHDLLAGKTVLVTAAAGTGIGFAAARRCAEEGAAVMISDIHERRLGEAAAELETRPLELAEGAAWSPGAVDRDVRRLGTIWLLDEKGWESYTARIGPEPLADEFTADVFVERVGGTRQAIKKAIMDQRLLAGVGNIYANEALFKAGIDPSRRSDKIERADLERLYGIVRNVLEDAIAAKGTTVRDYRTGTGETGNFQDVLEVYGRGGEPCPRCGAQLATTHAIDGRATTFCWRCQGKPA